MIEELRRKFSTDEIEYSRHALDQMIRRQISTADINTVGSSAELLEDYPNDKYGPSCLILGYTSQRPLHIHCSYPSRPLVKVITVYEPDPNLWINDRQRKP